MHTQGPGRCWGGAWRAWETEVVPESWCLPPSSVQHPQTNKRKQTWAQGTAELSNGAEVLQERGSTGPGTPASPPAPSPSTRVPAHACAHTQEDETESGGHGQQGDAIRKRHTVPTWSQEALSLLLPAGDHLSCSPTARESKQHPDALLLQRLLPVGRHLPPTFLGCCTGHWGPCHSPGPSQLQLWCPLSSLLKPQRPGVWRIFAHPRSQGSFSDPEALPRGNSFLRVKLRVVIHEIVGLIPIS